MTDKKKKKKKPNEMTEASLRGLYIRWMNNFRYGTKEIAELPKEDVDRIITYCKNQSLNSMAKRHSPQLRNLSNANRFALA